MRRMILAALSTGLALVVAQPTQAQHRVHHPRAHVRDRIEDVRDRREDLRDRRENVQDRREDRRARRRP